jgi:hypothetical protein
MPAKKKQPSKTKAAIEAMNVLDELADLYDDRKEIAGNLDEELQRLIPNDIKAKMAAAQARAKKETEALGISDVEETLKAKVLDLGTTIKNDALMACWTKPRVTWNTEVLDALAEITPAIKKARTEGEASVSIRKVKES